MRKPMKLTEIRQQGSKALIESLGNEQKTPV